MAEQNKKLKSIGRSASTDSTEYSVTMGKSLRRKSKKVKPKERWLLTRKTWRYMADAGKKLIPEGVHNRPEDIPKIEAYFQEICKKESRFLLWRKNSYPGAIAFRRKKKVSRKGGSCRKAVSADGVSIETLQRPTYLDIEKSEPGKFDVKKMKEEFFTAGMPSPGYSSHDLKTESHETEEKQLVNMLEQYLGMSQKNPIKPLNKDDLNYQALVDRLQRHLIHSPDASHSYVPNKLVTAPQVHFQRDPIQKCLIETMNRYYGQSCNRNKVVSDLLTDRKALEKLYFELRKTKGFRGSRGGTGYTTSFAYGPQRSNYENTNKSFSKYYKTPGSAIDVPPPLIEVQTEGTEIILRSLAIQTCPISQEVLSKIEEEYRKQIYEQKCEDESVRDYKPSRRRSSLEDDISQSVSNTIKRYLRMARKKSVDTEKAEGFKRVNYDRNLRNIKAKGEITKESDDDGLNKGCQTNADWILSYGDLKFVELYDTDIESRLSSARSSIDTGIDNVSRSLPSSPPAIKSHSFLSHLLHHHNKTDKHDKNEKSSTAVNATAGAMQKSKSSSSVMHQGSRLVARKIFRSRSKSQTRPNQATCTWTPQVSLF